MDTITLTFEHGVVVGFLSFATLLFIIFVFRTWIRAYFSGAPVPLATLVGMRLRGTPSALLVDGLIASRKAGHTVSIEIIESCYLANKHSIYDLKTLLESVEKHMQKS